MIIFNLAMAALIALVVLGMAAVKESRLKAVIYGLPLPITTALIATRVPVNTSHISGLFLLCCFLWSVFYLYTNKGLPILIADIFCAFAYIILGFLLIKQLTINFWQAVFLFTLFWLFYIWKYRPKNEKGEKSKVYFLVKGSVIFIIAYILFSLRTILAGIVVTFPFSGVFAVIEAKKTLYTLAGEFAKNSLAILLFFIVVKFSSEHMGFYQAIGLGWLFYLPALILLQKVKRRI